MAMTSAAAMLAAGKAKAATTLLPKFHASFGAGVRAGLGAAGPKAMAAAAKSAPAKLAPRRR